VSDLQAARAALLAGDWERALELSVGAVSAELLDVRAEAHWWLGDLDACIEAREAAYALFEAEGDLVDAGRLAVRLWEHHVMKTRPSIAGAWLRRGRRALEDRPECPEVGALLLREAEVLHGSGDLARAKDVITEAHALSRRLRSLDLEAESLQALGRVLLDEGALEEGMAHLDEAMLLAVEGRLSPYSHGKVFCSMISACEQLGDLRRAAEWTDATMRWSESHPRAMWPGICRVHHAALLQQRGDWVAAEREAERACDGLAGFHVPFAAAGWVEIGEVRRRRGDLDGADRAFTTAEQLSGAVPPGLALVRLAQGRVDEASSLVRRLLAAETWNALSRGRLLPAQVEIALAAQDLSTAEWATTELERIARDFRSPVLQAAALTARGRVELHEKEWAMACVTLQQAVTAWHALEVPYEVATAQALLATGCRGCGDDAAAAQSRAQADAILTRLGVVAPTGLPCGLTAREAEVLVLVAAGATNRQVAEQLFLSERTVARHLSNVFVKTGVSTRTAAAAFAFEQGLAQKSGSGPASRRTSAPSDTSESTKPS
jgi:DNA-binding CsgD family transcriptional regulator